MSQSNDAKTKPEVPISSKDIVRGICGAVHELSRRVMLASATADTVWGGTEPTMSLSTLRLNLANLGESVARLRWLSMALVSAQLEVVETTLDLSVVVKECLFRVRPSLPEPCNCTCAIESGLIVHADLARRSYLAVAQRRFDPTSIGTWGNRPAGADFESSPASRKSGASCRV